MRKCPSDEEVPVGCQLFNNRKCGNKEKCLQTQEDTGQEETGAKPKQGKFSSFELGERRENDTCEEAVSPERAPSAAAGVGGGCQRRHPR